jgi:3-isopropylmalate/(R)-2-methylmalate dehydratase small subunit
MQAFTTQRGLIATLDRANIDTDQLIPKQFLKSVTRTGYGENLFYDWSRTPDGAPNPDFALNQPRFRNARFLAARHNFGCGSSREHAVWALMEAGYAAVIAPWKEHAGNRVPAFADIFRNNAAKNGLLTVELAEDEVETIFQLVARHTGLEATVDLANQRVVLHAPEEVTLRFAIEAGAKHRLLQGLDDIGLTLEQADRIAAFEARHDAQMPSGA